MSIVTGNNGGNGSSSNASATVGGWIRNSVARSSFGRRTSATGSASTSSAVGWNGAQTTTNWLGVGAELDKVDPSAAYYTFSKHWQQMVEIMERTRQKKQDEKMKAYRRDKKKDKKRKASAVDVAGEVDPEMAKLMGFGGFGTSKKL